MTKIMEVKPIDFNDIAAIKKEIDKFIKKYAYADIEHALIISPKGNYYVLVGDKISVDSSIVGKDNLAGSISIHNHPVPKGDIIGDSFSKQDLMFAVEYKTGKQHLISGERRNTFIYTGNLGYDDIITEYRKALNEVREWAWDTDEKIVFEHEKVMKVLNKNLKGFVFYGNI